MTGHSLPFKNRLLQHEPLVGTFLKTPTTHATEILGDIGFDFVVVDAEHAPFDRSDIDMIILAGRAARISVLVRVQTANPVEILSVLDCGAVGVLVPHVADGETMRAIVSAARYTGGRRGFSNSPRAGGYGRLGFIDHIAAADDAVVILAMIEDPEALDHLDEIFAVDGLNGAFIGRGDLSARLGAASVDDPVIRDAVMRISAAARRHSVPLLAHVGSTRPADTQWLSDQGVRGFIVASDQGLMRQAGLANLGDFVKSC